MARPTSRVRSKRSEKVRELRASLGDSQQAFSNRLGVALNTVNRWETFAPPSGDALVKLAGLAEETEHREFADFFRAEYLEDVGKDFGDLRLAMMARLDENQRRYNMAYLFARLVGNEEIMLAQYFIQTLQGLRREKVSRKAKETAMNFFFLAAEEVYKKSIYDKIAILDPEDALRLPLPEAPADSTSTSPKTKTTTKNRRSKKE